MAVPVELAIGRLGRFGDGVGVFDVGCAGGGVRGVIFGKCCRIIAGDPACRLVLREDVGIIEREILCARLLFIGFLARLS